MTRPVFHFVPAVAEDFDYYYDLRKRTMLQHFINAGKDWPEELERQRHREGFSPKILRMIHVGEERVGFVNVMRTDNEVHINAFCIEPKHQNQGIGTNVMKSIMAEPEHRGCLYTLDVLINNPAHRLYERLGFIKTQGPIPELVYYIRPAAAPGTTQQPPLDHANPR